MSTALVLVAVTGFPPQPGTHVGRPRADFLAQLIATVAQAPQTRLRRRAEPGEATAIYDATARREAARPTVSRSL